MGNGGGSDIHYKSLKGKSVGKRKRLRENTEKEGREEREFDRICWVHKSFPDSKSH